MLGHEFKPSEDVGVVSLGKALYSNSCTTYNQLRLRGRTIQACYTKYNTWKLVTLSQRCNNNNNNDKHLYRAHYVMGISGCTGKCPNGLLQVPTDYSAVASLTVPGGQEFHFPQFPQIVINFSFFFLKLSSLSSSIGPSAWATCPFRKALAKPLPQK